MEFTDSELKDWADGMPSFLPFGKVGDLQIPRCRWFAIDDDGFTLGALALKLSNFCNIRVDSSVHAIGKTPLRGIN